MSPLEGLARHATAGSEPIVEITPAALAKLVELRDAEPDADKLGLRLEIASAPGEDFRYDLSFDEYLTAAFTDEVRTHDGLKVVSRSATSIELAGATLDHTETQGLVIRNPNRPAAPVIDGLTTTTSCRRRSRRWWPRRSTRRWPPTAASSPTSATTARAPPT